MARADAREGPADPLHLHLIQPGYWLWLIQLESGPISIGVCADPRFHPWEEINSFEGFMDWMKRNEPQLHAEIDGRREDVLDFLRVQDFSYGSTRFFSPERWTLVGEAGGFLDALYSPGSDFIGFSNTFSAELIERELDGEDVTELAEFYNDFYLNLFNTTAHLYRDNYQLFGNPQVMVLEVRLRQLDVLHGHRQRLVPRPDAQARGHQAADRDHGRSDPDDPDHAAAVPRLERARATRRSRASRSCRKQLTPYVAAQADMAHAAEGDEVFEISRRNLKYLEALAVWIFHRAARNLPEPPDENRPINWLAISLHPERWEADGLYSDDGISLAQAREMLPGIEEMDLEARGAVVAA